MGGMGPCSAQCRLRREALHGGPQSVVRTPCVKEVCCITDLGSSPRMMPLASAVFETKTTCRPARHRMRCLAGRHVVFVSNTALASGIMRGELPKSVMQQTSLTHGVRTTLCGPPCNASRLSLHWAEHGPIPPISGQGLK